MQLFAHQQRLLDKNPKRCLIAHDTGTGKTITVLSLAEKNKAVALVIVPKALKENWGRAVSNFSLPHKIVSKEEFRRDWESLPRYAAVIIDEAHFFANEKSLLSKALRKYTKAHKPSFIWLLTATPYCSTAMNIYALANHLGHNISYWSFFTKYFYNVRMGSRMVPVQRPGIEKELSKLIQAIGDTCKLEDCIDVPEQTFETVYLTLTPSQEKAIKEISDTSHITRWTRRHTIENGVKIGDEYTEDEYYDCNKNDYIIALAEQHPKMAVICRYNLQIESLKSLLEKEGKKVFIINGEVKNRDEVVQQIESTPECVALIQASCSVGFEIPSVPVMVFGSLSFSYIDYKQALGRILRINKPKKNLYLHLVMQGGVDEDVYNCIMNKKDFSFAIYNK